MTEFDPKKDIEPGETVILTSRPGGEPDEVKAALELIKRGKALLQTYTPMEREDLEREYKRIYSDFELYMKFKENLDAILGVLVEKYHLTNEEIRKLRS